MDSGQEYEYDDYSDDGEGYTYHDEESDHCASPKIGGSGVPGKPELKRELSSFTVPYDDYIIKSAADIVQLMRALSNEVLQSQTATPPLLPFVTARAAPATSAAAGDFLRRGPCAFLLRGANSSPTPACR